ncbi:TPA: polysaccharide lyase family 8 super-sandwich domain-containing protein [Enterococcus faecalis]
MKKSKKVNLLLISTLLLSINVNPQAISALEKTISSDNPVDHLVESTETSSTDTLIEESQSQDEGLTNILPEEDEAIEQEIAVVADEETMDSVEPAVTEEVKEVTEDLADKKEQEALLSHNLITNGDFSMVKEQQGLWTGKEPQNWGLWIPSDIATTDYTAEVNTDNQLVLSSLKEEFRAAVNQKVTIDPQKNYQLSFNVKTEELSNIARIRINEQNEQGQTNLWYSKSIKGTNDWQTIVQDFTPNEETSFITMEIFFEKGTGTLYFDDISFTEKQEDEATTDERLEEEIQMHTHSIYLPWRSKYVYEVTDTTIANVQNELIYPLVPGETTVKIYDEDHLLVREIPLAITEFEANKYSEMLQQWNNSIAGNSYYDSSNVAMVTQNNQLDSAVADILANYSLEENSHTLWKDIKEYDSSANITTSYRRVETIAKQVTQPASKYYQDPTAIRVAKNTMAWMYTYAYNENLAIKGNWWDYEIGAPRAINNALSLMNNYFSIEEIVKYTEPINYFIPDPYNFRVTIGNPFKALGGNLVDMGRVKIISAALREEDEVLNEAVESIEQVFDYASSGQSGFFEDGSYIDHDNVALTGAYGNVLIDGLSQLFPVVIESGLLDESKLGNLYRFIDNSFLPLIYNGEMMDMTRGRAISRQQLQSHAAGGEAIRGILRVANSSDTDQKNRLNELLKTFVTENTYYDIYNSLISYKDIYLMDNLLQDTTISTVELPSRLSIFNKMDKVSYQNMETKFGFAISMYSDETQNYEYMNQENAYGWYTSDGAVYLYNDDLSHYNDNYWATVNPYHIPGTTIIPGEREVGSGMVTLPSSFVGGTKLDELTASVAMEFSNWNSTLQANKSWFILNDKVVFLGSNIQQSGDTSAMTTIENRKNNQDTSYTVLVNGDEYQVKDGQKEISDVRSLLLKSSNNQDMNIGYTFLEDTDLTYLNETNQGSWQEINASQSDQIYQNNFSTFYQTHDEGNDSYAYVMYPNISEDKLAATEKDQSIEVIQNDETAQAIYDKELNSWGIVLYEDQGFKVDENLTVTKQGIYSIKKEKNQYSLSYYNPSDEIYPEGTIVSDLTQEVSKEATAEDMSTIVTLLISQTGDTGGDKDKDEDKKLDEGNGSNNSSGTGSGSNTNGDSGTSNVSDKKSLPQTGELLMNPLVQIVGVSLVIVAGVLNYRRKKIK